MSPATAEFEGCGLQGPIRGVFLADFHPQLGPRIRLQTDPRFIPAESFSDLSDYLIPKQRLSRRHVTVNGLGHKVVGYPVVLEDESYARNQFIFNVCFVCHTWSKTVQYESAIEKLSRYLQFLEHESRFLSADSPENNAAVLSVMEDAAAQLNSEEGRAVVGLGKYKVSLYVFRTQEDPPPAVRGHDVPVVVKDVDLDSCDLTTRMMVPHMDGLNFVTRIALLAGVDIALAKMCVRDLVYLGHVRLVPIFQFGNSYCVTDRLDDLRTDPDLRAALVREGSSDPDGDPASFRDLFRVASEFRHGARVDDLTCWNVVDRGLKVDMPNLVRFLVIEGVLRRIHHYPVYRESTTTAAEDQQQLFAQPPSMPADLRALMNGARNFDEICCLKMMSSEELEALVESDPNVVVLQKAAAAV